MGHFVVKIIIFGLIVTHLKLFGVKWEWQDFFLGGGREERKCLLFLFLFSVNFISKICLKAMNLEFDVYSKWNFKF